MGVGLRGTGGLVLLGLAMAVIGGCGGEDDLSKSEATKKLNALCRQSADRSENAGGPEGSSGESFVNGLRAQVREFDRLQGELEDMSLGGPSQAAADYVAAHDRAVEASQATLDKLTESDNGQPDQGELNQLIKEQENATDASIEAAEKAGLDDCGPRTREIQAAASPVGLGTKPRSIGGGQAIVAGSGFVGIWKGLATQNGPGARETRTYPVSMGIEAGYGIPPGGGSGEVARQYWGNGDIRYPSFHCSGRVKIVEAGSGPGGIGYRYKLEERIYDGRDKCGSGGTITAVSEGDELDWRWKDDQVEATAILGQVQAPKRMPVSEQTIRELQGHEYSGTVTQWGPRGQKASYQLYYVLYPPDGPRFGPGDGHTQSYDGPCMGNGVLHIESVSGDRAVLRRRFDRYSNCIGGGVVETRLVGDKLLFRWLRQGDDERGEQEDVIALGTLSESGPARGPAPG